MAIGNREVTDLPLLSVISGSDLYAVKADQDYRIKVGGPNGLAYFDTTGRLASEFLQPNLATFNPSTKASLYADVTFRDIYATRGDGTGTMWFGQDGSYIHYDGSNQFEFKHNGETAVLDAPGAIFTTGNFDPSTKLNVADYGWATLSGKPTTFTPAAHTHAAGDITSGVMDVARLGSGTPSTLTFLRGDGTWATVPATASIDWTNITSKPVTATRWPDWSEVTNKPTTLSGYGITDAYTKTESDNALAMKVDNSGSGYFNPNAVAITGTKMGVMAQPTTNTPDLNWTQILSNVTPNGAWGYQMAHPWFQEEIYFKQVNNGTHGDWRRMWHSGNFDPSTRAILGANANFADISASRGDNSGVIYIGNAYVQNTGSAWQFSAHTSMSVGGYQVWTQNNFDPATKVTNGGSVATITKLTQAAYDAIGSKDDNTLYVIVG